MDEIVVKLKIIKFKKNSFYYLFSYFIYYILAFKPLFLNLSLIKHIYLSFFKS